MRISAIKMLTKNYRILLQKVNTMRLSSFFIFGSILPLICAADGDAKSLRGLKEVSTPVASNADGNSNFKRNLQQIQTCGAGDDGNLIWLNNFEGDSTDEQVFGCNTFHLDGATWNAQLGADVFGSSDSFDGWEGCCYVCGLNLQIAGLLSPGWYCEKDFFSTGIWLKH
jgi:hypothetical protein